MAAFPVTNYDVFACHSHTNKILCLSCIYIHIYSGVFSCEIKRKEKEKKGNERNEKKRREKKRKKRKGNENPLGKDKWSEVKYHRIHVIGRKKMKEGQKE